MHPGSILLVPINYWSGANVDKHAITFFTSNGPS